MSERLCNPRLPRLPVLLLAGGLALATTACGDAAEKPHNPILCYTLTIEPTNTTDVYIAKDLTLGDKTSTITYSFKNDHSQTKTFPPGPINGLQTLRLDPSPAVGIITAAAKSPSGMISPCPAVEVPIA